MNQKNNFFIGTAGWSIPKIAQASFPAEGSHLERYSRSLSGVEVNSCFYRDHLPRSYEKWAEASPPSFRFSLKLHQRFTHDKTLFTNRSDLRSVLNGMRGLGGKWDTLLMQFPGSLLFDPVKLDRFYGFVREEFEGRIAVEPRHTSWLEAASIELMKKYQLTKVRSDPERCFSEKSLDFGGFSYYRLHGSPVIYRSDYDGDLLSQLAQEFSETAPGWCVFDNTTFGYAAQNALTLKEMLETQDESKLRDLSLS